MLQYLHCLRCMDQEENPFQGIRLGSCHMDEKTIINTFAVDPDKCSKLCKVTDDCEFWKARWDGSLCYLLTRDYRQVSTSSISSLNICFISYRMIPIRHLTGLWIVCQSHLLGGFQGESRILPCLCWGWLCLLRRENRWVGGSVWGLPQGLSRGGGQIVLSLSWHSWQ